MLSDATAAWCAALTAATTFRHSPSLNATTSIAAYPTAAVPAAAAAEARRAMRLLANIGWPSQQLVRRSRVRQKVYVGRTVRRWLNVEPLLCLSPMRPPTECTAFFACTTPSTAVSPSNAARSAHAAKLEVWRLPLATV